VIASTELGVVSVVVVVLSLVVVVVPAVEDGGVAGQLLGTGVVPANISDVILEEVEFEDVVEVAPLAINLVESLQSAILFTAAAGLVAKKLAN
jgi:hypothetical protein